MWSDNSHSDSKLTGANKVGDSGIGQLLGLRLQKRDEAPRQSENQSGSSRNSMH
jgi:hypothetical protein